MRPLSSLSTVHPIKVLFAASAKLTAAAMILAAAPLTQAATIAPLSYSYSDFAPNHSASATYHDPSATKLTNDTIGGVYTDGNYAAWNGGGGGIQSTITFVFDQAYDFSSLTVYGYINASHTWAGYATGVSISTSSNNVTYSSTVSPGTLDSAADVIDVSSLDSGQYVRFSFTGSTSTSLWFSEIDFEGTAIPEPATALLGSLGLLLLLRRRRSEA